MQMIQNQHLLEINQILSMYQTVSFVQLCRFFKELPEVTVQAMVKRMKKQGRITYDYQTGIIRHSGIKEHNKEVISALWILLDFFSNVTYHTVSNFPAILTFYTDGDGFDVISIPCGKETLYNNALTEQQEGNKRLIIIQEISQIQKVNLLQIAAFCLVSEDGRIQYYEKQGEP